MNRRKQIDYCPKCKKELLTMYGGGWDWDRLICTGKYCNYEKELNVIMIHEEQGNGTIKESIVNKY